MGTADAPATRDPKGIVKCFIAPDGHVVATVTDFDRSGYGGCSLREAQEHRCRVRLQSAIVEALCHPIVLKATSDYERERLTRNLCEEGYRVHTIVVGHESDNRHLTPDT